MATILDDIKQKKSKTFTKISVKVPTEIKDMIDYIVEKNSIDRNEYIAAILDKSEIRKVYNAMLKENNSSNGDSNIDGTYDE